MSKSEYIVSGKKKNCNGIILQGHIAPLTCLNDVASFLEDFQSNSRFLNVKSYIFAYRFSNDKDIEDGAEDDDIPGSSDNILLALQKNDIYNTVVFITIWDDSGRSGGFDNSFFKKIYDISRDLILYIKSRVSEIIADDKNDQIESVPSLPPIPPTLNPSLANLTLKATKIKNVELEAVEAVAQHDPTVNFNAAAANRKQQVVNGITPNHFKASNLSCFQKTENTLAYKTSMVPLLDSKSISSTKNFVDLEKWFQTVENDLREFDLTAQRQLRAILKPQRSMERTISAIGILMGKIPISSIGASGESGASWELLRSSVLNHSSLRMEMLLCDITSFSSSQIGATKRLVRGLDVEGMRRISPATACLLEWCLTALNFHSEYRTNLEKKATKAILEGLEQDRQEASTGVGPPEFANVIGDKISFSTHLDQDDLLFDKKDKIFDDSVAQPEILSSIITSLSPRNLTTDGISVLDLTENTNSVITKTDANINGIQTRYYNMKRTPSPGTPHSRLPYNTGNALLNQKLIANRFGLTNQIGGDEIGATEAELEEIRALTRHFAARRLHLEAQLGDLGKNLQVSL